MECQTTWSLSGFGDEIDDDPELQVAVLQALGASAIEIRSAWGVNVTQFDDSQLTRIAHVCEDHGMSVSAIASPIGKSELDAPIAYERNRLQHTIDVAHALHSNYIRIFSFYHSGRTVDDARNTVIDRVGQLVALAESENVILLHENEKGIFGELPANILDMMRSIDSASLRVAWDPANFVQVGISPYRDAFALLRPYFSYLQVKDAHAVSGIVTEPGGGDGELAETVRALADSGYAGFASMEPHLAMAGKFQGYSGPVAFGRATRAFREIASSEGVILK